MSLPANTIAPTKPRPARYAEVRTLVQAWEQGQTELLDRVAQGRGFAGPPERFAQAVCAAAVHLLRRGRCGDVASNGRQVWNSSIPLRVQEVLQQAVAPLEELPLGLAGYLLSGLYPRLLPRTVRARLGAYYTPPLLVDRLLDLVEKAGVVWATARVLDPACGGGAFLLPVAERMLAEPALADLAPETRLAHLESHLFGIEIDTFAAWMTREFLFVLTHDLRQQAGRDLDVPVLRADALRQTGHPLGQFDLVIGNPPYGRMSLDEDQRRNYSRSLFGHANSYGVFLDAALRWRQEDGLVAFVTPTSLLGGQYFSKLRGLLLQEAPPLAIDVVHERTGVFESVQQETCLAVFGPNPTKKTTVHLLTTRAGQMVAHSAGQFPLSDQPRAPWILPRTRRQALVAESLPGKKTRLHDLGYRASTGPLVWNRHKDQLCSRPGKERYPLIWAEAVRANHFSFDYQARADVPFFHLGPGQGHLLYREPCVLVQRTTAKEQHRRLIACAVPTEFLKEWDGIVVENHVNLLRRTHPGAVSPATLAAVLNTQVIDLVFRCISGSVAVSATELHALPLPDPDLFSAVEKELRQDSPGRAMPAIETLVARAYGVDLARLV